jgi:lysophospholipase L1-like esterase
MNRLSGKLLLMALSVLLCLLLGEGLLRLRQYARYRSWDVPGWLRVAGQQTKAWHPFLRAVPKPGMAWDEVEGEKRLRVTINSLGFRSPEIAQHKPPGTFRIVTIGASVVFDTRVSLEESWAYQLEQILRAHFPSTSIEVVNAGIPGRTTADSLVNLGVRLVHLDPDVAILMEGVNDQRTNRMPGFKPDYAHWYAEPACTVWGGVVDPLLDHSLLLSHARHRLKHVLNPHLSDNARGRPVARYDTVAAEGLEVYRRNLVSMIGICRAHGIEPVLATVGHSLEDNGDWNPSMGTPNPLLYYHAEFTMAGIRDGFAQYNRVNREVAQAQQCTLVDIERLVPEGKAWYQDDVHFTAQGSRKAAEVFAAAVPWEQWLQPHGGR